MYKCKPIDDTPTQKAEADFTAISSKENNDPEQNLVVKVCDVEDAGLHRSAQNEKTILQNLDCAYINKFIGFYEDSVLNKTYLVLESAGSKNLIDFVSDIRGASNEPQPLDENHVRSIMTQLFEAVDYLH